MCVCSACITFPQKETKLFIGEMETNKQLGNSLANIRAHVTLELHGAQPGEQQASRAGLMEYRCCRFLEAGTVNDTAHYHLFSRMLTSKFTLPKRSICFP